SSSIVAEVFSTTNEGSQEEAVTRKKQKGWKGPPKVENKEAKGGKSAVASDENGNDNLDDRKKKEKKGAKNRTPSADGPDQPKNKETELLDANDNKQGNSQHQRRKSTANTPDLSGKNKSPNNNNVDKSSHRRGKSMANVGELQGATSKNGNGKIKG
ncbi:8748_t:CDS:1, partial [Acaulospora morrowiae]